MGFAARDDDGVFAFFWLGRRFLQMFGQAAGIASHGRLTNRRAQPVAQAISYAAEMRLGQGSATSRFDGCPHGINIGTQLVGQLLCAPHGYLQGLSHARQAGRIGNDQLIFKNSGHQSHLVVDQNELAIIGI